ncbi:MAG: hypothetical protein DRH12_00585 [Deltaproteobacteria bacterium]|nr:MAG: hypothetical protein DRH12_00585 [Deltaproteobacteria bacterium]
MRRTSKPPSSNTAVYCPELGQIVQFSYCRNGGEGVPCPKITMCWYDVFLVEQYLRENLSSCEWDKFLAQRAKHRFAVVLEAMAKY